MYTLEMCIPNIRHWWNGKPLYKFDSIDDLIAFMKANIPMRDRDITFIRNNDQQRERGNLANTSWYLVRKGERQMTEYTSF